ncbi:MAG: amino acid racemase [Armatimonadota bacterium]|nr:amino acid racemase [Armatimonadota bacterium]MDW8156880.1 amino acid racemase [Armatimonadota bacterium]
MARTVGVLGGMGPRATVDFLQKLVELTPAERDQDHLRVVVDSNPKIPDRSRCILEGGEDPTPALVATAQNLERAGADFLVIPCNTAHHFLDSIRRAVKIPVLDITEAVARSAEGLSVVGLLATHATVVAGLYQRALGSRGCRVLVPTPQRQDLVDRAIRAVKAGQLGSQVRAWVREAGLELVASGAQALVLGCTEIPLVVDARDWTVPVLDSTALLAQAAVEEALRDERGAAMAAVAAAFGD